MRSQIMSKAMVALLLMVFLFALGNLIFNIENLYIGEELRPEFYGESTVVGSPVATNSTLADALRYLCYGILGVGVLAIVLSGYLFTRSKDDKKWRDLLIKLAAVGVACVLIIVVLYTYDEMEAEPGTGNNPVLSDIGGGSSGNVSGGDDGQTVETPDEMKVLITLGLFFVIFAIIVLGAAGVMTLIRLKGKKLKFDGDDLKTKEVAETIQRAIDTLSRGTDARSTVIRCYGDMCRVMEKHGVMEEEHLTPREFEVLARDKLPVSEAHLHDLVLVFEEARYSDHRMSAEESDRAKLCLEKVRGDLTKDSEEGANGV